METFKITTDETLRETIQHGNNRYPFAYYPDNIWKFDFHRIDWHWHHELEFLYTAEGTAFCLIGTSKIELHKGCGIFINSGVLHRFEAQSSTFAPNIVFSPTLLAPENSLIYEKYILPVISSSVPYQVFSPSNTFGKQVLQLLSQICTIQETKPDNELCTIQLLFQLWNILQKNMDWTSDSNSIHRLNHKQARLQAMMQYIHDHYMEEITLETIAASASISKSGALHIFQTGKNGDYMVSEELKSKLQQITQQEIYKVIVSKPSDKAAKYRKIKIEKKSSGYQAAAYTQKQVFHEKIEPDGLLDYLSGRVGSEFLQLNAWDGTSEYMLLISKKGKVTYRCKKQAEGNYRDSGRDISFWKKAYMRSFLRTRMRRSRER